MAYLAKALRRGCADALRGGIRREQFGVLRLEVLQLAQQAVVPGIADDRVVEYVIAVVVLVKSGMQLRGTPACRLRDAHNAVLATRCLSW